MADIALKTADRVEVVGFPVQQLTLVAVEAIEAGAPCRIDATTGKATNAKGTDTTEMLMYGIAIRSVAAGEAVTLVRRGVLDGFTFTTLDYGVAIFLSDTDGRLADAAGTKAIIVGRIVPGTASSPPDKLLMVDPMFSAIVT